MHAVAEEPKLTALRKSTHSLADLPDTVLVPGFPGRCDETIKPIKSVTLDDIAFALLALEEEESAIYREIESLRTVYAMARKSGAVGTDFALDAISVEKVGK